MNEDRGNEARSLVKKLNNMYKWKKVAILSFLFFVGVVLYFMHPWFYISEPIEGWVVDAETKEPLADVIVVINWSLHQGTLAGDVRVGHISFGETVTDLNGHFFFPKWTKVPKKGRIRGGEPELLFFKPRYSSQSKFNALWHSDPGIYVFSDWHEKTIELEKHHGTLDEYAQHLSRHVDSHVSSIAASDRCDLLNMPELVRAIENEYQYLNQENIKVQFETIYAAKNIPSECKLVK